MTTTTEQIVEQIERRRDLLNACNGGTDIMSTRFRIAIASMANEAIAAVRSLPAPAAEEGKSKLREKLQRFVNEEVCPVCENCVPGFVSGAYWGWGEARNRVGKLLKDHPLAPAAVEDN